jgi:hypothetical protein
MSKWAMLRAQQTQSDIGTINKCYLDNILDLKICEILLVFNNIFFFIPQVRAAWLQIKIAAVL